MKVIISALQREIMLEVGEREAIIEIKRKIQQELGIPISSQTLSVSDWELLDGLDMEDYPIVSDGTRIDLAVGFSPTPKAQITVNLSSTQHRMDVETTETLRTLRERIAAIAGTTTAAAGGLSLFLGGRELDDDRRSLDEYGVGESSEITVFRRKGSGDRRWVSLVVETSSSLLNGARIPVCVSDRSSVSDLGELLLSGKVLPLDDYLFVHRQRIMRNAKSLRWHGVEDGDFIYVFKGTVSQGEF